jgi:hypothetical protein
MLSWGLAFIGRPTSPEVASVIGPPPFWMWFVLGASIIAVLAQHFIILYPTVRWGY